MNVLLKSATLIDASNKRLNGKKRDVLIKNGKIEKIASDVGNPGGYKEIRLSNLHLSVGWFDSSVCFGEPGFEERETIDHGLRVAAQSGFTDILLNPNTSPTPDNSSHIVFLKERAAGHACNLHPMGAVTKEGKVVVPDEEFFKTQPKANPSADEVVVAAYRTLKEDDPSPEEKHIKLLEEEVRRVISLSPDWEPGSQRGTKVNVLFTFPVTFTLQ